MKSRVLLIAHLSASALILAGIMSLPFDLSGSTMAYAKGGGGNGNGGGNSGDHGNGGGGPPSASLGGTPGNSGDRGSSHGKKLAPSDVASHGNGNAGASGKAGKRDSLVAKGNATEQDKSLNAKLGALHAVNANLQAFIHASPNSRVGKLAAYAQALVGLQADEQAVKDAEKALSDLGLDPTLSDDDLTKLEATLTDQSQIDAIEALLTARSTAASQQTSTGDLLAAAANKPVDADVKAYVDSKLQDDGILDYYRALATTTTEAGTE